MLLLLAAAEVGLRGLCCGFVFRLNSFDSFQIVDLCVCACVHVCVCMMFESFDAIMTVKGCRIIELILDRVINKLHINRIMRRNSLSRHEISDLQGMR